MPFGVVSILSPWCDAAFLHSQDPKQTFQSMRRSGSWLLVFLGLGSASSPAQEQVYPSRL
jgi:hypothetical protein